ncbi:MAG: GGDEF domain-containing protein, partial [Lachnospiraceae bacterium]|nr:GGDEF domain-containing protein [Lachnospiraceae bacterium]
MKMKDQKSGGVMAAKKEKGLRRLKRGHFGAVVVTVVLIMAAVGICAVVFAEFFFHYVVDARVISEYHAVEFMASLYDREEGERAFQMLDGEGRSYLITDADGQKIHASGEITVGDAGGEYLPTSSNERIMIYMDEELPLVFPHEGHMAIRLGDTIRWINETGGMFGLERGEGKMELPFWICVDVRGGQQKLFGHAAFQLDMTDVTLIITVGAAFVLMVVIALILLICSFFSGIFRQHRMTALFFMDEVTGGRNWMWFLTRGEQLLRKRRNASRHFAVLDVVFVKYRNFCVCHSIAEGEKLLREVDRVITQNIGKKELSAHYASANFAVLLSYYEEAQLKRRITEIIGKLEKISDIHKFGFHVGVDPIAIETGKNGRPVRRRLVDLELEYNNACTARATLDGRDDSGIAFFDEKLVEEQRWIN